MMMMMLNYVNLLVEFVIMSCLCQSFPTRIITPLSYQVVTYLLVVLVLVIYIYIYIYMGTIICSWCYIMMVAWCRVGVGMDERVSTSPSQYCIMTTRSFIVAVHLLVVLLIADCWLLYVYVHISTVRWYYSYYLFVVYAHSIVCCIVLQLIIYCMVEQWQRYNNW